jgi:hypothetical protein
MAGRALPAALISLIWLAFAPTASADHASAFRMDRRAGIGVHVPDPGGVVAGFGSVWVQSGCGGSIWRISPQGRVLDRFPGVSRNPGLRAGFAGSRTLDAGFGSLWSLAGQRLLRINPRTGGVVAVIHVPGSSTTIAAGHGAVWVANFRARLLRIDPRTNRVVAWTDLSASPSSIAVGAGRVWVMNISEGWTLSEISPRTGEIVRNIDAPYTEFVTVAEHRVWAASADGSIAPLHRKAGRLGDQLKVARRITGVSFGSDTLWLNAGDLIGIDPDTGRVVDRVSAGHPEDANVGIAQLSDRVWLAEPTRGRLVGVHVTDPP